MLSYDIDWSGLVRVADELGGTDKQVKFALNRALRRTEATLRKMSSQGLQRELELRAASALRKRLKSIKLRKSGGLGASNDVTLWYGLNDLPVSAFKGRVLQDRTHGATFIGAAGMSKDFGPDSFVAKSRVKSRRSIFKRKGDARLPIVEQLVPIEDKAIAFIEDEIFDKVEDIFWQHFRRDLAARVRFQLGES